MSGALLYNIYQKQDKSVMSYSGMRHRITNTGHHQASTQTPIHSLVTLHAAKT